MPQTIRRQLMLLVFDMVADGAQDFTKRQETLSELAVEDSLPPLPAGVTMVAIPADVHFATFVAAFVPTL